MKHADFLSEIIKLSKKLGADEADSICFDNNNLSVTTRRLNIENIESANSKGFGLRVFVGKKTAITSSTDMDLTRAELLIKNAIDIAKASPDDEFMSLADSDSLSQNIPNLDLFDDSNIGVETMIESAKETEEAALAVDGVTMSEGASISYSKTNIAFATSNNWQGEYNASSYSISLAAIAGEGLNMQTDYEFATSRFYSDLNKPNLIGKSAATRTIRKLNPKQIATQKMPVIFDYRVSKSLLASFASAVAGTNIVKSASFLKDKIGEQIFSKEVNVIDDALIIRGLGSRPFDGEGLSSKKKFLVKDGILQNYLLDIRSANKLGFKPNASAARGLSSHPSPATTNLYIDNGKTNINEVIKNITNGLFVTDLFGMGINIITGDYSQGATGFLIENGELTYAVSEITIAGNLNEMFKNMLLCDDLMFRYSVNSPSLLINQMTIAGA